MIKISNLFKSYEENIIFKNVNLEISQNGLYLLDGENGSGKTTLFNLLSGFETINSGEIAINNEIVSEETYKKYLYYYNVDFNLVDYLTVKDNLANLNQEKLLKFMEFFEVRNLLSRYVYEISKGEKARIGLIKALLSDKQILFLDEPFAYLDIDTSRNVYRKLKEYSNNHIVIFSDHYFKGYEEDNLNNLQIKNKNILFENLNIEKNKININLKTSQSKKKISKLTFFIFFRHKMRYFLMLLTLFLSSTLMFTSLNFSLTSKSNLYEQILNGDEVSYASVEKNFAFSNLNFTDDKYLTRIESGVSILKDKTILDNTNSIFLTSNKEISFDSFYRFPDFSNQIPLIISRKCANDYNLNQGDNLAVSLDNLFEFQSYNLDAFVFDVVEELDDDGLIFMDADTISKFIVNPVFSISPKAVGLNQIGPELSMDFYNNALICFDKTLDDLLLYSYGSTLKDNEINLILYSEYIDDYGKENFNSYFSQNLENRTLEKQENINNEFSIFNYFNEFTIRGYKVIDSKAILPVVGAFGIEISNDFANILNKNIKNDPYFGNVSDNIYFSKSNLINIGAENCPMYFTYASYDADKNITYSDFNVLEGKDTYEGIFISISIFCLLLSICFFTICCLHIVKENSKNFYVLLKDSYSYTDLYLIFALGQIVMLTISLLLGLVISPPISSGLNSILSATSTLTFEINYFVFSEFNFLILIAIFLLLCCEITTFFYFNVKRKKVVELGFSNR